MGAGISKAARAARVRRGLYKVQRELAAQGVESTYRRESLIGKGFTVYYAGIGPASNGESFAYLVLRVNPQGQPDGARKVAGDVDYTDFHTRDIPEHSLGGFAAGVARVKSLA